MDDDNILSDSVIETPAPVPEAPPAHIEPESSQPDGSKPVDLPPEATESPINAPSNIPIEDQNGGVNQPESEGTESSNEAQISEPIQPVPVQSEPQPASSAPTPPTPPAPQPQSSAQQDQSGFIHALLVKAQAKIQSNKQKKLDKIILFAQKKKIFANEDVQKLLHISSATATRYMVKLVEQGRLARVGSPRDAKYQFVR